MSDYFEMAASLKRDDGTPAQVGDWWWIDRGQVHFAAPCPLTIPNRLYGVEINHEGDAI